MHACLRIGTEILSRIVSHARLFQFLTPVTLLVGVMLDVDKHAM